jgi:predicted MPP superfamily phosphohydrolase
MGERLLLAAWIGAIAWPVLLCFWLWRARRKRRRPAAIYIAYASLVSLAWACLAWAFLIEPEMLVVRRIEVVSPRWSGPPLRIGIISDIHSGAPHMRPARLAGIVARMNAEHPDVVVLLGDFAGRHEAAELRNDADRSKVMEGFPPLKQLSAPLGVVAVLGNHDQWYDPAAIRAALVAEGIPVLENTNRRIDRPDGPFWLAGLVDMDAANDAPSHTKALAGVPEAEPVIVLSHWPDPFAWGPPRPAITLAGHSHCGQVNIPFVGRPIHASRGSQRWPCGLYTEEGRLLYVTGGVGVSILPVRFNQPPEIVILTLRAP